MLYVINPITSLQDHLFSFEIFSYRILILVIYLDLLFKAPELLRLSDPPPRGSQKGDIYSFAIITQEFHTREGPWSTSYLEPHGKYKLKPKYLQGSL